MIFTILLFVIALILFLWSYLIWMNFVTLDYNWLISNYFQSQIINEKNFMLTSWYMQYYNNSEWNNDFYCNSYNWVYEDKNCLFRSYYWFLPPNKKIDLWIVTKSVWTNFVLLFSWNIFSWVDFVLNQINWNKKFQIPIKTTNYTLNEQLNNGLYNIKLTNKSNNWIQYFLYLSGSEWIKNFQVNSSWSALIWANYNYYFWKKWLLKDGINFKQQINLNINNSLNNILNKIWLQNISDNQINYLHYFGSWINYTWLVISNNFNTLSSPVNISVQWFATIKSCIKQIKWYYLKNEQSNIVFPLDTESLDKLRLQNLYSWNMSWWLYTYCSWDLDSIYWKIDYSTSTWENLFSIHVGRSYNFTWNSIITWVDFKNSMQIYEYNGYYLYNWLIYDTIYGIWYVGWKLENRQIFTKIIDLINSWNQVNLLIKLVNEKSITFIDTINSFAIRYYKNINY